MPQLQSNRAKTLAKVQKRLDRIAILDGEVAKWKSEAGLWRHAFDVLSLKYKELQAKGAVDADSSNQAKA